MKSMKRFVWLFFTLWWTLCTFSYAQDNSTIYQIQLAAYEEEVDWDQFKNLKDVGLVTTTSITPDPVEDNYIHVYVGKYLGKKTALAMYSILKKRGFTPSLDQDDFTLKHSTGKSVQHTIQLGVFNTLNMKQFVDIEANENLYILYEGGKFKVLYGLYPSKDMADAAREVLTREGFAGIVRTFR